MSVGYERDLIPEWCHYPELSSLQYGIVPVYRTIQQFTQHKENNDELYTEPFYTGRGGYKMTLCVYPNGCGSSRGTHVSVFICLMKGENDGNLPFPISGIFTVQLMNWKGNNQHSTEKCIMFDDSTPIECREQVITGDRADGWGKVDFISHDELKSTSSREYLKEDMMCFRISYHPLTNLPTG